MAQELDKEFFNRAGPYINLANSQCNGVSGDQVRTSFTYAAARFASWVFATNFDSGYEMQAAKQERMDYLVAEFRAMLEAHMNDHIDNFAKLMTPPKE